MIPFKLTSACPYERAAFAIVRVARERRLPPDWLAIVGNVVGGYFGPRGCAAIGGMVGSAA